MKAFIFRLGDALSQVLNVLFYWSRGTANHSVSGDAYRFDRQRTLAFIDWVFSKYEDEHCRKAHEQDIRRAKAFLDEVSMARVEL